MKIFFPIILLIFTSGKPVRFDLDLGLSEIQAVCKVTLKDGKTIEGFITFGNGGYDYKYRRHGFCRIHESGRKKIIPFDFSFNLLSYYRYGKHQIGTKKLYYAENITQGPILRESQFNEKQKTLTITKTDVEKYQLSDEMVMYKKIPIDLYLAYKENNESERITIKMNEIKSVELLKTPSKNSIELIKRAREKQIKAEKEDGYWTDYQQPVWLHEIIMNKEEVDYFSKFF